ncbi:MAG TPA: hypothetical protein VGH02_02915 [Rhizomicrobium sp.]|jgi:hypothetical protein
MGFWGWILAVYAALTAVIAIIGAWSAGLWFAACVVGASFLAAMATGGFKAAFFGGDKAMKIAASILAAATLGLAYWLSLKFDARILGVRTSGVIWAAIGTILGYAFAEKGESYYLPEPNRKSATN